LDNRGSSALGKEKMEETSLLIGILRKILRVILVVKITRLCLQEFVRK